MKRKHLSEFPPLYFIRLTDQENMFLHFEVFKGKPSFIAKPGFLGAPAWTKEKGEQFLKIMPVDNLELVLCSDLIPTQEPVIPFA
jgi:hypothetical protein